MKDQQLQEKGWKLESTNKDQECFMCSMKITAKKEVYTIPEHILFYQPKDDSNVCCSVECAEQFEKI
jgi:hypothetical protein